MKEVEFKCPRCGGKAFYYPVTRQAGCLLHGWLLYTEIPQEVKKPKQNMAKKLLAIILAAALLLAAFVQLQSGRAGDGPKRHDSAVLTEWI
jgi:hypothetical protein